MNCIVSVDNKWGIGKNNRLLFHIPADMEFFKQKTVSKVVVMGKNTLLSLPNERPLPKRTNIVLSTTLKRSDCIICGSLAILWEQLKVVAADDIFVIGGEKVYKQLLPYCTAAYITKVNSDGNATEFFPNIDSDSNWNLSHKGQTQSYVDTQFCFCEYINKKPLTFYM